MFWLTRCVSASCPLLHTSLAVSSSETKPQSVISEEKLFDLFPPPLLSVTDLLVASFRSRVHAKPKAPLKITSAASCKELMSPWEAVTLIPGSPCQSVNSQWWNVASSGPVMFPINHAWQASSGFVQHWYLHVSFGLLCLSACLSVCLSIYIQVCMSVATFCKIDSGYVHITSSRYDFFFFQWSTSTSACTVFFCCCCFVWQNTSQKAFFSSVNNLLYN